MTCLDISNYFPYFYRTNPRSEERLQEISDSFVKITNAPCFSKGDGKIYKNNYSSVDLKTISQNSANKLEVEIYRGVLYEFDKGVPFLKSGMTLCEDGFLSYSRGSGSCSWHGGYANQRGDFFTFRGITLAKDPRIELAKLKGD